MPSYLAEQPDVVVAHMVSWCDFQSLVALRSTNNHRLKAFADTILEQRALEHLPVRYEIENSTDGITVCAETDINVGWGYADSMNSKLGTPLMVNGREAPPVVSGRGIKVHFHRSISIKRAWATARRSMLLKVDAYDHIDETNHDDNSVRLWQCLFSLLVVARTSSIQHQTYYYESPRWGWEEDNRKIALETTVWKDSLMFLISDNRKIELGTRASRNFELESTLFY
jgi:hypothetical protein